jgi:NADH-quinone oxidoreductase subunit J
MEAAVFAVCSLVVLGGAAGVVLARNPVHSALSLVATLFGIAVLFIAQGAEFLAAVQVIVYAGAVVVLFLFVIMLLGVDSTEDLADDPLRGQRIASIIVGVLLGAGLAAVLVTAAVTGAHSVSGAVSSSNVPNITQLARVLFTTDLFPFEVTSILLVIAVVGAVVLARQRRDEEIDGDEPVTTLGRTADSDEDADVEVVK